MSQYSPVIGSGKSGLEYRTADNSGKQAILSSHKDSSAPSYAEAGCIWLDDTDTPWILKIYDGSDWLLLATINATNDIALPANLDEEGGIQSYDENNAVTNVAQEYTATQNFNATTLTYSETISWDLSVNQVTSVTLTGDATLDAPTNMIDGATYILIVKQDSTGSRTLAYESEYLFPDGKAPELSTDASAVDIITFVCDGSNMYGVSQLAFA